jgi:hypothetical protein
MASDLCIIIMAVIIHYPSITVMNIVMPSLVQFHGRHNNESPTVKRKMKHPPKYFPELCEHTKGSFNTLSGSCPCMDQVLFLTMCSEAEKYL